MRVITKSRTRLAIGILLIIVVLAAGAYYYFGVYLPEMAPKPEILIGQHVPLTGVFAAGGTDQDQGAMIAVDLFNEKGGIGGRKIKVITYDDTAKPEIGMSVVEKLCLEDKVLVVMGGYGSAIVLPVSEVTERNKVPYVTTGTVAKEATERGLRYFFSVCSYRVYADVTVGIIVDVFKDVKKAALLSEASKGCQDVATSQRELLKKANIAIAVDEMFTTGTPDFTPLLIKIKEAGVRVILVDGYTGDYMLMIRQLKELKIPYDAFIGIWGIAVTGFIEGLGMDAEYVYGVSSWEPGSYEPGTKEEGETFVKRYEQKYGKFPTYFSMLAYINMRIVLDAIQDVVNAGLPLTRDNVRDALAKIDRVYPGGKVKFDATGLNTKYTLILTQVQGGKRVVVYPPERATVKAIYPRP